MRALFAAGLMVVLAACGPTEKPGPTAEEVAANSQRLTEFLNAKYEVELQQNPEELTTLGRKELYDRLDDYSEAGEDAAIDLRRASVVEMKAQFDPATLSEDARTSFEIWEAQLEQLELSRSFRRQAYIFGFSGPHTGLPSFLIAYHKVDDVADMEAYNARVAAIGVALNQVTERAKLAAADGIRMPLFGYEKTLTESTNMISGQPFSKSGPDSPLLADARGKIKALVDAGKATPEQAAALEAGTRAALTDQMKPAYETLIAWLAEDKANAKSGKVGADTLPEGPAFYNASLKLLTTTDMTADEIHELGLKEVARIFAEMEAVKTQTGFTGTLQEFFEFVRTDPKFYLPNTDAGRAEYIGMADGFLSAMEAKLPEYFGILPKAPLVVKRVEAYREEDGGSAHYFPPTPDGKTPGVFYAHLSDMGAVPIGQLESLTYHEGVPGHHLQIAIATELTSVPLFRTQGFYSAFSEGWGLYAEELGKEMGFYTDPYNDFGRLSGELWRAVRLVVDTGLHAKGWSEEEAVAYAVANSPRPETAVRSEVRRYLLWPGQATTYKIGMIRIQQLRDEAKAALGDKFDYRGFHDVVIGGGAMPLPVLEGRVRRWIERQKTSS